MNLAIELAGFSSRIVLGSWYGTKSAKVELGGVAHRNRLQFITSQVSTIGPDLTGRWDKTRRISLVWELLKKVRPSKFISHSVDIQDAPEFISASTMERKEYCKLYLNTKMDRGIYV